VPWTSRDHVQREESHSKEPFESKLLISDSIGKQHFRLHYVVGKGGFGKVWKVEMKRNSKIFAMKEMYKTKIIDKKSINSVMNERTLLARLKHPFLVNMSYAFQDR
jgi:serine/threonine kinase 32